MYCASRQEDIPATWLDVSSSFRIWDGKHWTKNSVVYISVTAVDPNNKTANAAVVLPCFDKNVGAANDSRFVHDLKIRVRLIGHNIAKLVPGFTYVIFGTMAPVRQDDGSFDMFVPCPGRHAGISKVLGASVPWHGREVASVGVGEIFAGAMGGWSQAIKHSDAYHVAFAVDVDPEALRNYRVSNGGCITEIDGDFDAHFQDPSQYPVVHADVGDFRWLAVTLDTHCQLLTASFPCGPWSRLGNQDGLNCDAGRALIDFLRVVSLTQPLAVCFENVPGFRAGQHYQQFQEQLASIGFKLVFSTVHDLQMLSYSERKRWLAVAVNVNFIQDPNVQFSWAQPLLQRAITFDPKIHAIVEFAGDKAAELLVTESESRILRRFKKDREILRKGDVLPTLAASFRDSLSFDPSFLERKGLFAWLLDDGVHPVRWISAIEAARSLGFASATMLPSDEKLAIKFVGNCISPYHAALTLHYAAKILIQYFQCPIEVDFLQLVRKIDEGCQSFARFRHWFIGDSQFMCDPNMLLAPAVQPVPSTNRKRTLPAEEDPVPGPFQHRTQLLPPTVPFTVFNEQVVDPTPISLTDITGWTFRLPGPLVATPWKQWLAHIRPWLTFDNNAIQPNGVFIQDNFTLEPATEYNIALFRALRCAHDANTSGVVDLFDNFIPLPPPAFPVRWRTWASASGVVLDNCWATCGDRCLEDSTVLMPPGNFVIKLRMRMRGGAKDVKSRLKQHLVAKGVPEDAVEARVQSIINVVPEEQLASIFKQLDPWASLKNAIGNRVRLITQDEIKAHKSNARKNSRATSSTDPDPWALSDPWLEARQRPAAETQEISVKLLPGQFTLEDGTQAPVIDSIQHQACGVCLISANQLSTLASMTTTISTFECGGTGWR